MHLLTRTLSLLTVALGGALAGLALSSVNGAPAAPHFARASATTGLLHAGTREQLTLTLIVNATCTASRSDSLQRFLSPTIAAIRRLARRTDHVLALRGIAANHDIESGLTLLRRFPELQEISTGRSWLNHDVLALSRTDPKLPLSVPQVLVTIRHITVTASGIQASDDSTMYRFIGLAEIAHAAAVIDSTTLSSPR